MGKSLQARAKKSTDQKIGSFIAVICLVVLYVFLFLLDNALPSNSTTIMLVTVLKKGAIYALVCVSMNLLNGFTGLFSLGQAGFMLIGAYAYSIFSIPADQHASVYQYFDGGAIQFSIPESLGNVLGVNAGNFIGAILCIIIGGLVAAVFAALIGIPVLRLNGDYLAIVTLAFGELIKSVLTNTYLAVDKKGLHFSFLTDKNALEEGGLQLIRGPMGVMNTQRISTFTVGFVLVVITLVVIFNLVNSRTGRAIMAARDNRIAAESVGISVTKYKMIAFVVSAALAGAAGTLYGCSQTTFAATKFDFNTSILILVFVVLGGLGNMWGSVIAAAALTILPEALRQFSNYRMLVYAIVLILVMLATNNPAIWGFFARLRERREEKKGGAAQ